jgi:hypothetical protein
MKKKLISAALLMAAVFILFSCQKKEIPVAQEEEIATARGPKPPPPPPPSNDNCSNATTLTPGDTIYNQTTLNATVQSGEVISGSCITNSAPCQYTVGTRTETVWYSFTAVSASMYVDVIREDPPFESGCSFNYDVTLIVYSSSSCVPGSSHIIECQIMANDLVAVAELQGLTIGNTYLVQVGNAKGTSAKCKYSPVFKIVAGSIEPACSTCNTPCGSACQFLTTPASGSFVAQNCTGDVLIPRLQGNKNCGPVSRTLCYTFTAAANNVDWGLVRSGNCTYTTINWQLQSASCSGVIQSGSVTSLQSVENLILGQLTGLTIGEQYTMCFTLTPNAACWLKKVWPFFSPAGP